jgi:vesicle-fusing ATPase
MLNNGYTTNINLDEIAKLSVNFTGAEIESIVKNAVSYSISREIDVSNLENAKNIKPIITQDDLIRGFEEIKPLFGSLSNEIGIITSKEFTLYSDNYKYIYDDIINNIKQNKKGKIVSFLIHGDYFVGKTTLACNIMKNSNIGCIKFINSEKLINSYSKDQTLYELFENGYKTEILGIILDSVEKIIEYSRLGNQYNNKILQVIYTILDKVIENNKSVYIILTSSNSELMDILDFTKICHNSYKLFDENEISKHFRQLI